jgi:glycosyltransferase involved in cell wall biosynthesis
MRILFAWHGATDPNNFPLFDGMIAERNVDLLILTPPRLDDRQTEFRMRGAVTRVNRQSGSRYRIVPGWTVNPRSLGYMVHLDLPARIASFRPDVVHVVAEAATLLAAEAALLRMVLFRRPRLVLHVIQNIYVDYRWPWPVVEKFALSRADAAVAYNPGARNILLRRGFRKPIYLRPFGAEDFSSARTSPVRRRMGRGAPVIGWNGRMFMGKGLHVLLEASSLMRQKHRLLVVGDGPRREAECALAHKLGINSRITWAGMVPISRIGEYYRAMDIFTHPAISRPPDMPAWKEQFARTLPEAMLCGLPTVGSRSGEIPWVLGDGALIVPERKPLALARALDRLVSSRRLRADLGRRARKRAVGNFTWKVAGREMVEIWRDIIKKQV